MGTTGAVTRVDGAALRAAARDYDTAAGLLDAAVRNHLQHSAFGAATAGRAYVAEGAALRSALDGLAGALQQWSRAAAEVAAALRDSADRFAAADARAAGRVG
jgi:uncharacterized protein YukE